ncbi:hypothetical protein [Hymenobacter daeguensis]
MSNENWGEIRDLIDKAPLASRILFYFIEHMNRRNAVSIKQKDLCLEFSRERNAVSRALGELKARRLVAFERDGSSIIYHVNAHVCWRASAKEKSGAFLNHPLKKAEVVREVGIKRERRSIILMRVREKRGIREALASLEQPQL